MDKIQVFSIASNDFIRKVKLYTFLLLLSILFFRNSSSGQSTFISLFVNSSPQYLNTCINADTIAIDTFLIATDGDGFGYYYPGILTWSIYSSPLHGTVSGCPHSQNYTSSYILPSGIGYIPDAGFSGMDAFTIQLVDTFGDVDTTYIVVSVLAPPTVITGPSIVCLGDTTTLFDSSLGGTWTSSDSSATIDATSGFLTGTATGTATITYSTGCGSDKTKTIAVDSSSGAITGSSIVCTGSTITLTDTLGGGTWTSGSTSDATISGTGIVTGIAVGTTTITYSIGCGTDAYFPVTVNTAPVAGSISGTNHVCVGAVTTYTDTTGSGSWSVSSSAVATIDSSSGILTGVAGGSTIISYVVTNVCGTAHSIVIVSVNPLPTVSAITGLSSICPGGSTTTLSDVTAGGTWFSSNTGLATVSSGIVTGIAGGVDTISYALSNSCGTTTVIHAVTVNPVVSAGYIYGVGGVCATGATSLTDAVTGGTWHSSNTSLATVSAGTITGISAGTDTISYTYTTTCGTNISIHPIVVGSNPIITTIAGNNIGGYTTDGVSATGAELFSPYGVAVDSSGNLYIGDVYNNRIRKVSSTGIITTIAGTGTAGFSGDGGPATAAMLNYAMGIAVDGSGNVYFCDAQNNRIRKINTSGTISTVAGDGTAGFSSDGIAATLSELNNPTGIAVDGSGNIYIADYYNNKIRKVNTSGFITSIAGTGTAGYSGDEGHATLAALNQPAGVAVDAAGNVYIAGNSNNSIRQINSSGIITTIAGGTTAGFSGDGGIATAATLDAPIGVAVDATGNIYVADQLNNRIRKISSGIITSIAGNGTSGYSGDMGSATASEVNAPAGLTINTSGNIYIADAANNVIRVISPVCGCSGSPTAGYISATDTSGCSAYSSTLSLIGSSNLPGITFQWQSSVTGTGFTNITGATLSTYTTTISTPKYYQCIITCSNSGLSATTTAVYLNEGLPAIAPISGLTSVCSGSTITLADTTSGGIWSASDSAATVSSGVVTGVTGGTDIISYLRSNSCGTSAATYTITVNPLPAPGPILGPHSLCLSTSYTLTDSASGGSWNSSSTGVVTISGGGVLDVISAGSSIISYTITNVCGTSTATVIVSVYPVPTVGTITGTTTLCLGDSSLLSDIVAGGVWNTYYSSVATMTSGGLLTGVASDTTTISYTITNPCGSAVATTVVTVNPLPYSGTISGTFSICPGSHSTLTDIATGGTWTSVSTGVATITDSGVVTAISAGTSIISYVDVNSCGTSTTSIIFTVAPLPDSGSISGSAICAGDSTILTETSPGGVWSSLYTGVATIGDSTGVVNAISGGTTTISYVVTNSCGTATATKAFTVYPLPTSGTITGTSSLCVGTGTTLYDASGTGTWSSSNPAVAAVSSLGIITDTTVGTATISYTVSNSCGTSLATFNITVNPIPAAGTITGSGTVCTGSFTTLSDAVAGGMWSSTTTSVASITSGGVIDAISFGTSIISYTITTVCGSANTFMIITVNPLPEVDTISGTFTLCTGVSTDTLQDIVAGGTWSSSTIGVATISGTGILNALSAGTTAISYTVTNSCGTASTGVTVTVNPLPVADTIMGAATVCAGSSITLTDSSAGGAWSSSSTGVATVLSGIVHGISGGTSIISYLVTNSCGNAIATRIVTVNPLPVAGVITGSGTVCQGLHDTLNDLMGGTWSSSNLAVATISGTGILYAIASGTTTISFNVTSICGSVFTTRVITVNPVPSAGIITGSHVVCQASSITLTDTSHSGIWSSSDISVATTTGDTIYGGYPGTAIISYTVVNVCGTAIATSTITVNPLPRADTIWGSPYVCYGSSATLSDSAPGGVWSSSSTGVAVIIGPGIVVGLSLGSSVISYTVTNSCGTAVTTKTVSVIPLPAVDTIIGVSVFCAGSVTTFSDSSMGGFWTTSDTAIATILGSGSIPGALITGVFGGHATITYSLTGLCGSITTLKHITVNPLPDTGIITGTGSVCTGASITLSDTSAGGTWSASNATATITAGIVTGFSPGIDTIHYSKTNGCGTLAASHIVIINPYAGIISGLTAVCHGSTITLTDDIPGGTWGRSNVLATVAGGVVAGITPGIDTISYTVVSSCGSATAHFPVVIDVFPVAGTITGPTVVCAGSSVTLSDIDTGGAWYCTNGLAIISSGLVTGINAGNDTALYVVTNACGADSARATITITPLPVVFPISGSSTVCMGSAITLTDFATGGVWAGSNILDTVTGGGIVTGSAASIDSISYTVTNSCGSAGAWKVITINPLPFAGVISGPTTLCAGDSIILTESVTSGSWTCINPGGSVTGGVFRGTIPGSDTVIYSFTNVCGTATANHIIIVKPLPHAAVVSGASIVCTHDSTLLTDSVSGGRWHSGNAHATINDTTGIVTGITMGADTLAYTVSNSCGISRAMHTITINPSPNAGTITGQDSVCNGGSTFFTDSVPGGTWSCSNSLANISGGGSVYTLAAGIDTIMYSVTNSCGTDVAYTYLQIDSLPHISIAGTTYVCVNSTDTLHGNPLGGTWASLSSTATITASGIVSAVSPGIDTITYYFANKCGSSTGKLLLTVYSAALCPTGVNNVSNTNNNPLKVYPNPSGGEFTIEIPAASPGTTLVIMDLYGKTVYEKNNIDEGSSKLKIDLGALSKGTYLLRVATGDKILRDKIVLW